MNDCLDNFHKCKANCCRMVSFSYKRKPSPNNNYFIMKNDDKEMINYYVMHEGIRLEKKGKHSIIVTDPKLRRTLTYCNKYWLLIFASKCEHLREDGKCKIYDSPERPKVCKDGYNEDKGILFCPNCVYEPEKDSLVITENVVERVL